MFSQWEWTKEGGTGYYMKAFDLETGDLRWKTKFSKDNAFPVHVADSAGKFSRKMDLSGHQEPVAEGNLLFVPFMGVHCIDMDTGELKWGVPFKTAHKSFKKTYAPLIITSETVYAMGRHH